MTVKNLIVLAAMIGATGWYFTKHRTAEPQPLPLLNCPGTKMDGDDDGIASTALWALGGHGNNRCNTLVLRDYEETFSLPSSKRSTASSMMED